MRRVLCMLTFLLFLASCHTEAHETLMQRYENFHGLLNAEEITQYEAGAYADAAVLFTSRLAANEELKRVYTALKAEQSVELFSVEKVMRFYSNYVYPRIEFYKSGKAYEDMIN